MISLHKNATHHLKTAYKCMLLALFGLFTIIFTLPNESVAAPAYNIIPEDKLSAVAYSYFQIDEDAYPEMSLSFESFNAHIDAIENEGISPISIKDLLKQYEKSDETSNWPKTPIIITFETAHNSIDQNAIPLLLREKIPFTLFISPAEIDQSRPYLMNWERLKKLYKNPLVTIGVHSAYYRPLSDDLQSERSILSAITRYKEVFGEAPEIFAYPYGDHHTTFETLLNQHGIKAAFGLQSGVIYKGSNLLNLPRYTMTDTLGSTERFINAAYNLPLPHMDQIPENAVLPHAPTTLGFSVSENLKDKVSKIQCFRSGHGRVTTDVIGAERVQIDISDLSLSKDEESKVSRIRINCTLNAGYDEEHERTRWRWHGILQHINNAEVTGVAASVAASAE